MTAIVRVVEVGQITFCAGFKLGCLVIEQRVHSCGELRKLCVRLPSRLAVVHLNHTTVQDGNINGLQVFAVFC